eukprot:tig00000106_g5285.t1
METVPQDLSEFPKLTQKLSPTINTAPATGLPSPATPVNYTQGFNFMVGGEEYVSRIRKLAGLPTERANETLHLVVGLAAPQTVPALYFRSSNFARKFVLALSACARARAR